MESESFSAICKGKFSLLQRRLRHFNLLNGKWKRDGVSNQLDYKFEFGMHTS